MAKNTRFGFCVPNYGRATSKKAIDLVARISEGSGYDHIWTTDHLLIPEEFSSPYGRCFESLSTLAYLAGQTEHVGLGTSIIVLPLREVVLFAKQAASIQILSGGRLMLGLGSGWNEVEFQSVRAPFKERGQYYDEAVQLFRWLMKGNSEFKGDFYSITDGTFGPIPDRPIPLFFGGNLGPSLRRVAKFGNGWHPVGLSPEQIEKGARKLKELIGRKPRIILRISVNYSERNVRQRDRQKRSGLRGESSEILEQIARYRKSGVTDIVCYFGDLDLGKISQKATDFAREILPSA